MARTELTVAALPKPYTNTTLGLAVGAIDQVNGNAYKCTGREFLYFSNGTGGTINVTIKGAPTRTGRSKDFVITLATTQQRFTGLIPQEGFIQSDGMVWIDYDVAGLQILVIRRP